MGVIQSSVNQAIGILAGSVGLGKHIQQQGQLTKDTSELANHIYGNGGAQEAANDPEVKKTLEGAQKMGQDFVKENQKDIETHYSNYLTTGDEHDKPYVTTENAEQAARQKAVKALQDKYDAAATQLQNQEQLKQELKNLKKYKDLFEGNNRKSEIYAQGRQYLANDKQSEAKNGKEQR